MQKFYYIKNQKEKTGSLLLKRPKILQNLNGTWHFKPDVFDVGEKESWFIPGKVKDRTVEVPSPWQFAFTDLRDYIGSGWYERDFFVPLESRDRRVALVFEAVDYESRVWVNGKYAGEHVGGYSSFELDISDIVNYGGNNTVTVKVTDFEWVDFNENNHWNFHTSGIWRQVRLEESGFAYVNDIWIQPDIDNEKAYANVRIYVPGSYCDRDMNMEMCITGPDGREHKSFMEINGPDKREDCFVTVPLVASIESPVLWDLENPGMYESEVRIFLDGKQEDAAVTYFGMKKIETKGYRIYLNNKPIYLFGGLDLLHTGLNISPNYKYHTDEDIIKELTVLKEIGINFIRKCSCIEDPRYIYWCDRMGIFLQLMPPCIQFFIEEQKERWMDEWRLMIERDRSHPSVLIWSPINEGFGLYCNENWDLISGKDCAEFVQKANNIAKELDSDKLVIGDSGGVHISGNVLDGHPYFDFFEYAEFKAYIASLKSYEMPIIITEMGAIVQVPDIDRFKKEWNGTPWFLNKSTRFRQKTEYDHICVLPEGYEERFVNWGIDDIYGDFTNLMNKSNGLMMEALKYQFEQIRLNKFISGHTYTNILDNIACHHGVIDFWRGKKDWADGFKKMLAGDLVIIEWDKLNYYCGERFRSEVYISHMCTTPLDNGRIEWELEGTESKGVIAGIALGSDFDVVFTGTLCFNVPETINPQNSGKRFRLTARLLDNSGIVNENYLDIFVYPRQFSTSAPEKVINAPVWQGCGGRGDDGPPWPAWQGSNGKINVPPWKGMGWEMNSIGYRLGMIGYDINLGIDPKIPVTVTQYIDSEVEEYIRDGGTVVLIADKPGFNNMLERNGLKFKTMTMGSPGKRHFIRKESGICKRVSFDNPLGWPFYKVAPRLALVGLNPDHHNDQIAGYFGHYINFQDLGEAKAFGVGGSLVKLKYGKGRMLVSTFRLSALESDPVAHIMLEDIFKYAFYGFDAETELV